MALQGVAEARRLLRAVLVGRFVRTPVTPPPGVPPRKGPGRKPRLIYENGYWTSTVPGARPSTFFARRRQLRSSERVSFAICLQKMITANKESVWRECQRRASPDWRRKTSLTCSRGTWFCRASGPQSQATR